MSTRAADLRRAMKEENGRENYVFFDRHWSTIQSRNHEMGPRTFYPRISFTANFQLLAISATQYQSS